MTCPITSSSENLHYTVTSGNFTWSSIVACIPWVSKKLPFNYTTKLATINQVSEAVEKEFTQILTETICEVCYFICSVFSSALNKTSISLLRYLQICLFPLSGQKRSSVQITAIPENTLYLSSVIYIIKLEYILNIWFIINQSVCTFVETHSFIITVSSSLWIHIDI